ncbi:MAG: glutamate N-acetyltransferase / amino-acid N-acetyltransferase [Thermoleophilales bacterium]|nr:glutamate N-acetyltransferase / amino-acid N-acetyltransferase [Thermoleophilales bacterium]
MTFFRSRWVDAPAHVTELDSSALPAGYRAAGVAAGIKPEGLDVGLLVSDEPSVSAARFCTNALVGAPVVVSQAARTGELRAILASSGNANVSDGERGLETARAGQHAAADALGLDPAQVGIAATGVIGRELPRERLLDGVRGAAAALGTDAADFTRAIMTTDRGPKRACLELALGSGTVRIAAQAKGAGMMSPRFATMFCFVETDAAMAPETVDLLTGVCVKRSFDRISVDGQLSTSDTVFVLANGAAGITIEPESEDELRFGEALDALMRQLAYEIVADGEGARRVGRVVVRGAPELVDRVARAVADSPLVKTQLYGADPNFGRLLQSTGQALAGTGVPFLVDLEIEGRQVVSAGQVVPLDATEFAALEEAVKRDAVEYVLTVPGDEGETEVYFSDLGHEYVTINADYTT